MIQIKIPSKTFLVGEYVSLNEGPALILNTGPEFCYNITKISEVNEEVDLHKKSPSYKLFKNNFEKFKKYNFEFIDPHFGKGGFGASGAKFNGLLALQNILEDKPLPSSLKFRDELLYYSETKESGYDVVSQFNGKICYINIKNKIANPLDWPFKDLVVTIVRTGNNIKTHEHLKNIKLNDLSILDEISSNTVSSFLSADENKFNSNINLFYTELVAQKLICEDSRYLVSKIKKETSWFHSVKACGAAGADTIVAIHEKKYTKKTKKYFEDINLELIFTGNEFSPGMDIKISSGNKDQVTI